MFVVEVSPLLKGANLESLTYFSSVEYEPGTLLRVPVRNKEATAMVITSKPVSAAKAAVRAATFSLRRLPGQPDNLMLSPLLIKTAEALEAELPATFGSILFSLLPTEVREGEVDYPFSPTNDNHSGEFEVGLLTSPTKERWLNYKSLVREAFAHRGSVLFVVPTSSAAARASEELLSGIKDRGIVFSSGLTAKSLRQAFKSVTDLSTSKLIITTPQYAFIDRHDITRVIIDESRSQHYKARTRPYVDYKNALIKMAEIAGRKVLLGDLLHRFEDEYYRREDIYSTEGEEQLRVAFNNSVSLIVAKDKPTAETPFTLFSPALKTKLEDTLAERKNVFVYAARRGLAPVVACNDCGHVLRDPNSGTPYSLFKTVKNGEEKRWFLSTVSGRRVKAEDVCPECGSWRLKERGVGIQFIEEEFKKYFPKIPVFVFDHTTASTIRKANTIMSDFYAEKGAVLIGTSMAVPYLEEPVSSSVVTSLDSVRSVPTWRVDEDCFALLLSLREKTEEELIIQTRHEPDELITYLKNGQLNQFFNDELKLRSELNYPPFARLVHLTISGKQESVKSLELFIEEALGQYGFSFYSSPDSTEQHTTRYGLLRIEKEDWPKPELMQKLRELPLQVKVEIDPSRLV